MPPDGGSGPDGYEGRIVEPEAVDQGWNGHQVGEEQEEAGHGYGYGRGRITFTMERRNVGAGTPASLGLSRSFFRRTMR